MADAASDPATMSPDQLNALSEKFRKDYAAVRQQIGRIIVGNQSIIDGVLVCLFTGGHALLEGVPGIGKTLLIRSLAQALSLDFSRIQFTPDLMPADISGTTIVTEVERATGGISREFTFQPGPIFAQIVLADEINRATPKTQSAMLEAMQERHVTVAGETHHLPKPFFVMATQNPIEQEGTYPLPEAQLDRFFFKLIVGYSSRSEMKEILERTTRQQSPTIEPVLDGDSIRRYQQLVRMVAIADHVEDYAVRLVLSTHPTGEFGTPMVRKYVAVGASPRAAQALVLAAKCRALVSGRPTVGVEDIQKVAKPALRHRILVNFEADADGIEQDAIIENAIQTLPREQS